MKQGQIWQINLSPTVGAEIKKKRPAVIINDDAIGILPLKVIVPITEWKDRFFRLAFIMLHTITQASLGLRMGNGSHVTKGVIRRLNRPGSS